MNLTTSQSSHFYAYKDGIWTACHEVPYADVAKGMRKTTLADAKKMGLFPSVTGYCSIVNEPGLNNYWKTQAIMSALTLPRKQEDVFTYFDRCVKDLGQAANDAMAVVAWCHRTPPRPIVTDDEHAQAVVLDMEAHSEAAKRLGTEIHDVISYGLHHPNDPWLPPTSEAGRLALPAQAWLDENLEEIYAVEQIVGSLEHGYAGTLDLRCKLKRVGHAVVDYKSQNVKRNGKGPQPVFYFSYGKQLAAYAEASDKACKEIDWTTRFPALVSIIIDKANNGEVFVKVWENPAELWRQFLNNAESWRFENQYDPRVQV